jgi:DNA polymerase I
MRLSSACADKTEVLDSFREVVAIDFEFIATAGNRPIPVCLVAYELRSGRRFRVWQDELGQAPPYATGADVLLIAYYASAELGCYRVLGWPMPQRILDLFTEFRAITNGLTTPAGNGLLGALAYFGLDGIGAAEKDDMRALILGGGPWSEADRTAILNYCAGDVDALQRLVPAMMPKIDLPRALLRGRYMAAAAAMEHAGTPIDVETLELFRARWTDIQDELIAEIDAAYGVFEGRTFKTERFAVWLGKNNIPWPMLESGNLDLSDDTFRQQARAYPAISPLRELRSSLSDLRLNDLAVGTDGRNRTILSAFRSRTGRNQPSNTKFIFGPAVWLRGLIKPPPGHVIAYIDWSQQEIGIAAALSGDEAMQEAYRSGDCYLAFAKQAGAVPQDATKATHSAPRELFKQCMLAVQYGMEWESLALRIAQPGIVARDLLRAHRQTYRRFWQWSDAAVDQAHLLGVIHTVFGWPVRIDERANPRSLRNFPMQANGAEMLRIACCLATERGIEVCAPVHDAILICATLDRIDADIVAMRAAMAEASRFVLAGFELNTEVKIVYWPERYMDPRGRQMWDKVCSLTMRTGRPDVLQISAA